MRDVVEEQDGVFVLPLAGFVCADVEGSWLVLRDEHGDEARVSGAAFDDDLCAQLVGRHARVKRATANAESTLQLDLDGDVSVVIAAAAEYEAWEVRGPGEIIVVAPLGGGEPAIWDATSKSVRIRPGDPLPPELADMIEAFGMPMPFEEPKGEDE